MRQPSPIISVLEELSRPKIAIRFETIASSLSIETPFNPAEYSSLQEIERPRTSEEMQQISSLPTIGWKDEAVQAAGSAQVCWQHQAASEESDTAAQHATSRRKAKSGA